MQINYVQFYIIMVNFAQLKVAIAHDSFTQLGGAERVVEALHELYPTAPIFTLVLDRKLKSEFGGWDIRTSWLQVLYNFIPKLQYLLPFIPLATSSLDFSGYDVVISSSSSFIKNIYVPKNTIHINYCHTPTRFLWSDVNYVNQEVPAIIRPLVKIVLGLMKKWDYKGAQRVTHFIANSKEVQKRIKEYYKRDSEVIYPFVDTEFWKHTSRRHSEGVQPTEEYQREGKEILHPSDAFRAQDDDESGKDYFLIVGRLQAHKKNDLIVEIFSALGGSASGGNDSNIKLHIVGTGRQEQYLKSIAKSNIKFLGRISDEQLREEYSGAKALIFPQVEDFGLVAVEAMACGTPVLAYGKGGALETIVAGETGEFFDSYDKEKIKQQIINWNSEKYQLNKLRTQAEKFSKEKFKQNTFNYLTSNLN